MGDTLGTQEDGVPWKDLSPVDIRMELMVRLRNGERVSDLAREYGVSRKTIYKFKTRFETEGPAGLQDRTRRPRRLARALPVEIETAVLQLKKKYPTWGAKKIRVLLPKAHPGMHVPARSTIHEILRRNGAVTPRPKRRRARASGDRLTKPTRPNQVWAADFKGQFRLGDRTLCFPLTASDLYSRYLLLCEALPGTGERSAIACFLRAFRQYGIPDVIRTDNGVPFASVGQWGLSKLSVLWLRLGIRVERIAPGHPEQNGIHERMHRTLKIETTRPAGRHLLEQQERFDHFDRVYNRQRPHEALDMKVPADRYRASARLLGPKLPDIHYAFADDVRTVDAHGKIRLFGRHHFHVSLAFAHQELAIAETPDGLWTLGFAKVDLGQYDPRQRVFTPYSPLRDSSLGVTLN